MPEMAEQGKAFHQSRQSRVIPEQGNEWINSHNNIHMGFSKTIM
jgi:hypothetical protein